MTQRAKNQSVARQAMKPLAPSREDLLAGIHHIVHDYANLISSGTIAVAGKYQITVAGHHQEVKLFPPVPMHVEQAFLMNCRKLFDFFVRRDSAHSDDLIAADYLAQDAKGLVFRFEAWEKWGKPMNKRLLHITSTRSGPPGDWTGHTENPLFLEEFRHAWRMFRKQISEEFTAEFESQILERSRRPEYVGLDFH